MTFTSSRKPALIVSNVVNNDATDPDQMDSAYRKDPVGWVVAAFDKAFALDFPALRFKMPGGQKRGVDPYTMGWFPDVSADAAQLALAEMTKAEHDLSDAYLRIRTKLNAFDTTRGPTGEQVWAHTEKCLDEKLAALKLGAPKGDQR